MPRPEPDETQSDFAKRCIPQVMDEGAEHEQAVGKCLGMFRFYTEDKKENRARPFWKLWNKDG